MVACEQKCKSGMLVGVESVQTTVKTYKVIYRKRKTNIKEEICVTPNLDSYKKTRTRFIFNLCLLAFYFSSLCSLQKCNKNIEQY